jgi:hypothetical protein
MKYPIRIARNVERSRMETAMNSLRKAVFVIDSIPDVIFEGYTDDDTWNGWACPYFEKSEAERVLQASQANHYVWSYDSERDAFIVRSEDDPEDYEPEVFEAAQRNVEDSGQVRVYGIGAYSWIWELATQA